MTLLQRLNDALRRLAPTAPSPVHLRVLLPLHQTTRRASLASATYVASKRRRLGAFGIQLDVERVALEERDAALSDWCARQSADPRVTAAFVQLPLLGAGLARRGVQAAMDRLDVAKDVDGLTTASTSRLGTARQLHAPATALGVLLLLEHGGHTSSRERGAHVAIVGKGALCGAPLAALLAAPAIGASVTLCDVFSRQTAQLVRRADVLVTAVGGGHVITAEHIDPEADTVVVDVGAGDVSPDAGRGAKVFVPRVGELTVAALASNVLNAARMRAGLRRVDFVSLVRNAHLLPEHEPLPLDAALAAPDAAPDDDGRSEPWFRPATGDVRDAAQLPLESAADLRAALALLAAAPRDRPHTLVLHIRGGAAAATSDVDGVERLSRAVARATDIVCVAVQSGSAPLSPVALAADYCLTSATHIDTAALLRAPSALAVARARIGDVAMVPGVTFGDQLRDGSAEYLPSLLAHLRQPHSRARVAALQRKLELRLQFLGAANDEQPK